MVTRVRWKGFELPSKVVVDDKTLTDKYGRFIVEPFERGMGITIGNSLRRVLYSSIEGVAATSFKIKGVSHEFSQIKGVLEDVTDITLNIKQLCVKYDGDGERKLHLEANKKGIVTAGQITLPLGVEIVNPDLLILTLTEDADFSCDITVSKGRGYVAASENQKKLGGDVGTIFVDSGFSPVKRVKYSVEETRVGRLTNYDRLIIEIFTNGVVAPEYALTEAAKNLRKHLDPFVFYYEIGMELPTEGKKVDKKIEEGNDKEKLYQKMSTPISELDLSIRATNCLSSEKIVTVRDLVSKTEDDLLKIRNFGKTTLKEITEKLSEMGLKLGMDIEEALIQKGADNET